VFNAYVIPKSEEGERSSVQTFVIKVSDTGCLSSKDHFRLILIPDVQSPLRRNFASYGRKLVSSGDVL